MKHKRLLAILCLALVLAMAACTSVGPTATQTPAKTKLNVVALVGPTGIGLVKLKNDQDKGTAKNDYNITFEGAPDSVIGKITSGEVDVAVIPINVAGTLYNKTAGNVQIMSVVTGGVLYVVENGNTVKNVRDLNGKTLYASGQASTPEYVLDYILTQNGLKNADIAPTATPASSATKLANTVAVQYKADHATLAALVASGEVKLAMLPEPFVTTVLAKNPNLRVALDLNTAWLDATKAAGSEVPLTMSALVVRKDFAAKNPEAIKTFLTEYQASVSYVNANVKDAAALVKQYGIMADAALAEKAIPRCNIIFTTGADMKTAVTKLYEILFKADPKSIGGTLPKDDFFYVAAK